MSKYLGTATYSPEDNKLRLYPFERLEPSVNLRLRNAGFKWAPKQKLFVAPMWTPSREDLLIYFCGVIGDEDTTLLDRAEERAERFEDYSDKREKEANDQKDYIKSITNNIPFGQPILIGHHSEKRARKDRERVENGLKQAVKLWETSKYWEDRASGALHHAKYKERPEVRARRIKKIEADKRKQEKNIKQCNDELNLWLTPVIFTRSRALAITNYSPLHYSFKFPLDKYPRLPPASQYEGSISLWSALDGNMINHKQARNIMIPNLERSITYAERWLNHCNNRLIYEKAMLNEQGKLDLIAKKPRPKQLPLLNYKAPEGITIINPSYCAEKQTHMPQFEMTKAEYKTIHEGSKSIRKVNGTHRVKTCSGHNVPSYMALMPENLDSTGKWNYQHKSIAVFLSDSKTHKKPDPIEIKQETEPVSEVMTRTYEPPKRTEFDDIRDTLKSGVKTVAVPQLFPTPKEIAGKMAEYLNVSEGESILEPSAGTGHLLGAIGCKWHGTDGKCVAVELNQDLCNHLRSEMPLTEIVQGDFLEQNGNLGSFDKIIMNPPFEKGSDIKHIKHALTFLKEGGTLVALCANGPRQNDQLMPLADHWEVLPEGSFKQSGTNVNVVLLVINN